MNPAGARREAEVPHGDLCAIPATGHTSDHPGAPPGGQALCGSRDHVLPSKASESQGQEAGRPLPVVSTHLPGPRHWARPKNGHCLSHLDLATAHPLSHGIEGSLRSSTLLSPRAGNSSEVAHRPHQWSEWGGVCTSEALKRGQPVAVCGGPLLWWPWQGSRRPGRGPHSLTPLQRAPPAGWVLRAGVWQRVLSPVLLAPCSLTASLCPCSTCRSTGQA